MVECDSVKRQREAMKALWPRVRYRLAQVTSAARPVIDQVLDQVGPGSTPVMVSGLERLAFPGSEELGMWQNLNITRPRWARELPRTIVFWVTEDAHRLLATRAPDLYRFRSTAIDLRLPKSSSEERVSELRERIRTISATPATKLRWFTELWRETGERAALDGLLIEAMKGGGSLPEDARMALASRRRLVLSDPTIRELALISGLTNLKELSFGGTLVSDLSPLAGLDNLKVLHCHSTLVADLRPIERMSNLQELSCYLTLISDLSPISQLKQLTQLDCGGCNINSIQPIATLENLVTLYCGQTKISDLGPVSNAHNLRQLHCFRTLISDLSALKDLRQLELISCFQTQVEDFSPLYGLPNLRIFDCRETRVTRREVAKLQKALPNCRIYH